MSFLSLVTYPGDGATLPWTVPFPYLLKPHVKVYVSGVLQVLTTDYSWSTDSQITFVTAPPAAAIILIKRETSPSARLVDYVEGTLTEADLDTDSLQAFYLAQEAADAASLQLVVDLADERIEAGTRQIKNVVDPTSPSHAATKSYVDGLTIGSGNVPSPNNPTDDNKVIRATGGTFGWYAFLKDWISDATAFGKTWLGLADEQAARTNLSLDLAAHGRCRLILNGSSLLELQKFNGNTLVINGKLETIPATNPTLAATGLAVTNHFIYAYMDGATMTLEASTTGHTRDTTTGVEIKSGDVTRTLVGMARTVSGPAWINSSTQRFVISWFNRRRVVATVAGQGSNWATSDGSSPPTVRYSYSSGATTSLLLEWLNWADELVHVDLIYSSNNPTAGQWTQTRCMVDDGQFGSSTIQYATIAGGYYYPGAESGKFALAEGYHFAFPAGSRGGASSGLIASPYHTAETLG